MNTPLIKYKRIWAILILHSAAFCGRAALLAFVVFLLAGPFNLIKMQWPPGGWFLWDLALSALFFLQHSGMIRHGFRARMARFIPSHYHGVVFTLASSLALTAMVLFWQSSGIHLIGPSRLARWLTYGLFFLAAAGTGWGVRALKGFDPFGQTPIKARLSGTPDRTPSFRIAGPYRWMRHPLYCFVLVMIWSRVDLTADRLLFNLLWTAWIYMGTRLEEKDLVNEFGTPYKNYQKQVPMLIPWRAFKTIHLVIFG